MSSYTESPTLIPTGTRVHPLVWLAIVMSRIATAAMNELWRRQAIRELRGLDDHMLADIGLARDDIEPAARLGRRAIVSRTPHD